MRQATENPKTKEKGSKASSDRRQGTLKPKRKEARRQATGDREP